MDSFFEKNTNGVLYTEEIGIIPLNIGSHLNEKYNTVGIWYVLQNKIILIVFSVIHGICLTTLEEYIKSEKSTDILLDAVNNDELITDVHTRTRCVNYDPILYMIMLYSGYIRERYYESVIDSYTLLDCKHIQVEVKNKVKQLNINDLFNNRLQTIQLHWHYITSNRILDTKYDIVEYEREIYNYKEGKQTDLIFLSIYMIYQCFQGKREYLPWTYPVKNDKWKIDYHVPSNNFKSDKSNPILSDKPFSIDYTGFRFLPNLWFWLITPFQLGVFDYPRIMTTLDNFSVFKHNDWYIYSIPRGYKIKDAADYDKHITDQIFYMTSDHIILYGIMSLLIQGYSDEKYLVLSNLQNSVLDIGYFKKIQDNSMKYLKTVKDKGSYFFFTFLRNPKQILTINKNSDLVKMPTKYISYSKKPYIISWEYFFTFILMSLENIDSIFGETGAALKMWYTLTETLGIYESKTLIGFKEYNLLVDIHILTLIQYENRKEKLMTDKPPKKVEYIKYIALMCIDKLLEYYKDMETLNLDHYELLNLVREHRDSLINNQSMDLDIRSHIWKFFYDNKLTPFQLIPRNFNI